MIRDDTKALSERLDITDGKVEINMKNQCVNFKDLKSRMAALSRSQGTLPSNTRQNPRPQFSQGQNQGPNNGQKYTPPPVRQEQAKAITTRTGRSYDPPTMPNVVVSDVHDSGNDDADVDEEIEMEDNPTVKNPVTPQKPVVEPEVKPYKAKISFPQRFMKAKLKEQYDKFGMPNYAKFIKELVTDKGKMDENQIQPKLEDPGSFLITCTIRTLTCKAVADLGASISLMPYSYPIGIAENMIVRVGHIVFPVDFIILEMEEYTKVPLILGRPFLNTADAIIRVKDKEISLGVGTDRIVFNVERSIKHSYSTDESCFRIDVIDDALDREFQELMETDIGDEEIICLGSGDINDDDLFAEVMALNLDDTPPVDESFEKVVADRNSRVPNSVDVPPTDLELKPLPTHLEYAYLSGESSLPVIISSSLSSDEKDCLLSVLRAHKRAFAWKTTDIPVVENENKELLATRTITGWRVCIDYRKLNDATRKDHFPLPFIDQMLERLAGNEYFCFMDDFSVFGDSFHTCLHNLEKMLERCESAYLVMNWEKCHFMVTEGIVLGHKLSKAGIEVDRAKIDVIAKLPPLSNVKGVRSFLGHAGFYRRFIKDFSKITRPMTHLLEKDVPLVFDDTCLSAFQVLKEKLTNSPIMVGPD
uniref:uncharacterized protein LOC122585154 n=1 Tax=Erigeron canadensis TaxID=72917 RepID=UPI001CB8A181|nr:uncharacterized protein LOC122585154 [Erigeron canadensis]